jgi:hypothetical protein
VTQAFFGVAEPARTAPGQPFQGTLWAAEAGVVRRRSDAGRIGVADRRHLPSAGDRARLFARDDGGHGRSGVERNAESAPTSPALPALAPAAIGEVRYQGLVLACNRALLAARAAERGDS